MSGFNVNDTIMHFREGLSHITEIRRMNEKDYFIIHVVRDESEIIYVPVDTAQAVIRHVSTKEEAEAYLNAGTSATITTKSKTTSTTPVPATQTTFDFIESSDNQTNTYTKESTDDLTGTTNAQLTEANLKKTIAGFTYEAGYTTGGTTRPTSGAVTTTTILGDGTRVINLYYRRN
jgi:transcription-repair coupling factor (superfamily II helicase)